MEACPTSDGDAAVIPIDPIIESMLHHPAGKGRGKTTAPPSNPPIRAPQLRLVTDEG